MACADKQQAVLQKGTFNRKPWFGLAHLALLMHPAGPRGSFVLGSIHLLRG